jgi:hypothetical protein
MNMTLLRALLAMVPVSVLFFGSGILFRKGRTLGSFLQLVGACSLLIVVLTHFCEALHLFPWMHWGESIALVITSISGALYLDSYYFQ